MICAWNDESGVHRTADLDPGGWSGWQDIEVAPANDDAAAEETGEGSDGEKDALPDRGGQLLPRKSGPLGALPSFDDLHLTLPQPMLALYPPRRD